MVFNGGAGGNEAHVAVEVHGGLGSFGGEILDGLGLVQDDGMPLDRSQQLGLLIEQAVANDQHVHGAQASDQLFPMVASERDQVQGGGKAVGFGSPVHANGRGCHYQGRTFGGSLQDQG